MREAAKAVAGFYRSYVVGLLDQDAAYLDQDAAYDDDPAGEPPFLLADYRRALFAVLLFELTPLLLAQGAVYRNTGHASATVCTLVAEVARPDAADQVE